MGKGRKTTDESSGAPSSALRLVEDTLEAMRLQVKSGSCADLTRLLQLQRELKKEEEVDQIRRIEVTWIDPESETESCVEK